MHTFEPDYRNVVDAAYNRVSKRLPLYEHIVDAGKIGEIIRRDLAGLFEGDDRELEEFFPFTAGFSGITGMTRFPLNAVSGR